MSTDAARTLAQNLSAVARRDPALAESLRAAAPLDPALLQPTRAGVPTASLPDPAGAPILLASRIDPLREAERLIDAHVGSQTEDRGSKVEGGEDGDPRSSICDPLVYIVIGLGLGYHVADLLTRCGPQDFVVVAEANRSLVRSALERFDWSAMLAAGRLRFVSEAGTAELHRVLGPIAPALLMGTRLVIHPPSARIAPAFDADFRRLFVDFIATSKVDLGTAATNTAVTILNLLMNSPAYVSEQGIDGLKGAYAGYPAIIVAAGPSLARNIHLLGAARGRAVVIAVATTLKMLLDRGVPPHFVTCLDFHEISKRFFEDLPEEGGQGSEFRIPHSAFPTHLVFDPKGTWHVLDAWRGPVNVLGNDFLDRCLRDVAPPVVHDQLPSGSTVAHLALYLARYLGADPIILVGQDLGYSNGLYYTPGTAVHDTWRPEFNRFFTLETKEWERIVRRRSILHRIPDIHGRMIYTDDQMLTYLRKFEVDFRETKAQVIDATEGGARKEGVIVMPLADALERYATRPLPQAAGGDTGPRDHTRPFVSSESRRSLAAAALRRRIAETERIRTVCTESVDCLNRLSDCLDDPARAHPLFTRLNALRAEIKAADDEYTLVRVVGQIDLLRRFQADRRIAAADLNGPEKQRRQIARDLEYVRGIADECDLFITMLRQAAERLEATTP